MNTLKRSKLFSNTAVSLFFSLGIAFTAWIQTADMKAIQNASANLSHRQIEEDTAEIQQQLKLVKASPSLGFRNLVADGIFLSFLQYFSNTSVQSDIQQNLSPDFFESIIALDPFYTNYYLFLSSSTTLHAAQPEKTVMIMAKGLAAIEPHIQSDSFYIWRYKAVDELLFLGNAQEAQKSFEKAAEWAEYSDDPVSKRMGEMSSRTAAFLANDPESRHAQIAAWSSVLSNASNDTIRNTAVSYIEKLGGSVEFQEDGTMIIETVEADDSSRTENGNG